MDFAEGLHTFVVKRCLEKRRSESKTIGRDIAKLEKITAAFPAHHLRRSVVQMLQEAHAKGLLEAKFEWGGDFGSPDETIFPRNSTSR